MKKRTPAQLAAAKKRQAANTAKKTGKIDMRTYNAAKKKAFPVYKSGMSGGKPINFSDKKTKRGIITSLD